MMYCIHSLYVAFFGLQMLLGVDSDIHTYLSYHLENDSFKVLKLQILWFIPVYYYHVILGSMFYFHNP